MDNATHSLVGLLVAEVAIRIRERRGPTETIVPRAQIRWVSVIANNLPDLDVVYAHHYGAELGYILHHRGHTHTLLAGPVLSLVLFGCWFLACAWRRPQLARQNKWLMLVLSVLGPLTHLGLDALNNYGVHPFWPVQTSWVYGDSLFIIEPWLWVVLVPALAFGLVNVWAKWVLWLILLSAGVLAWTLEMVPWTVALALTAGGVASSSYSFRVGPTRRLYYALGGTLVVVGVFALGSRVASAQARALADVGPRLLDVVVTPSPGNPLCFGIITVTLDEDQYVARAGSLSLLPKLYSPEGCRVQPTGMTSGLHPSRALDSEELAWQGEWRGSKGELQHLARTHCHVSAWLRFARVPFWSRTSETQWLLGDLRFDRDEDIDFDEFFIQEPPESCPPWVPNWQPPRHDLLTPATPSNHSRH